MLDKVWRSGSTPSGWCGLDGIGMSVELLSTGWGLPSGAISDSGHRFGSLAQVGIQIGYKGPDSRALRSSSPESDDRLVGPGKDLVGAGSLGSREEE